MWAFNASPKRASEKCSNTFVSDSLYAGKHTPLVRNKSSRAELVQSSPELYNTWVIVFPTSRINYILRCFAPSSSTFYTSFFSSPKRGVLIKCQQWTFLYTILPGCLSRYRKIRNALDTDWAPLLFELGGGESFRFSIALKARRASVSFFPNYRQCHLAQQRAELIERDRDLTSGEPCNKGKNRIFPLLSWEIQTDNEHLTK